MAQASVVAIAGRRLPGEPQLYCRRPGCGRPLADKPMGRPAVFCSAECRRLFAVEQRRAANRLREQAQIAKLYDVDLAEALDYPPPLAAKAPSEQTEVSMTLDLLIAQIAKLSHELKKRPRASGAGQATAHLQELLDGAIRLSEALSQ